MRTITTASERIDPLTRMRRSFARFSGLDASNRSPSLADFITTTSGFRFSVHTGNSIIFVGLNLSAEGWTEYSFVETAVSTSTILEFGLRQDPGASGLDDISVLK